MVMVRSMAHISKVYRNFGSIIRSTSLTLVPYLLFTWMKMSCGFWNRLVKQTSAPVLRAAFVENLQLSIVDGVDKYWCAAGTGFIYK